MSNPLRTCVQMIKYGITDSDLKKSREEDEKKVAAKKTTDFQTNDTEGIPPASVVEKSKTNS